MLTVPFPPFTQAQIQRRFPQDTLGQHRILLLAAWLVPGMSAVPSARHPSRATHYRLRTLWLRKGFGGLLTMPPSPAAPYAPSTVRPLLQALADTTPFHLGCLPSARHLLPDEPDPAHRGMRLTIALSAAIQRADTMLQQQTGATHVLCQRWQHGMPIKWLCQKIGVSRATLYRMLAQGLHVVVNELPQALLTLPASPWSLHSLPLAHRSTVAQDLALLHRQLQDTRRIQVTGLAGVGKTALVATLAQAWAHAGWQIVWLHGPAHARSSPEPFFASWYAQLAAIGAVSAVQYDASLAVPTRSATLLHGLKQFPTLLILDAVEAMADDDLWAPLLQQLCAAAQPWFVVLTSQHRIALPHVAAHQLDGLGPIQARHLYTALRGEHAATEWARVASIAQGNPSLLHLLARHPDHTQLGATDAEHLLQQHIHHLRPADQRLLVWLWWAPTPVSIYEPFVAAATPRAQAWLDLRMRGLLQLEHDHLLLPSLVRNHLRASVLLALWATVRDQVEQYACTHADWALAYSCAEDGHDRNSQYRYSRALADTTMAQGTFQTALRWWRICQEACDPSDGVWHQARLEELEALFHLRTHHTMLLRIPPPEELSMITDPQIAWLYALIWRLHNSKPTSCAVSAAGERRTHQSRAALAPPP